MGYDNDKILEKSDASTCTIELINKVYQQVARVESWSYTNDFTFGGSAARLE